MSDYGIAIDIGTTTVSMSLIDIEKENKISSVSFDNPQAQFGEDVITRMEYQNDTRDSTNLTELIRNVMNSNVSKMLAINDLTPSSISNIVVVGNTPMHHLFFDIPTHSLLKEPFKVDNPDEIETTAEDVGIELPQASCYAPPLIESFVGSDALGVILGFGLANEVHPSLTLDIGTNSEIIVQYYNKLWVASAASGPAFEGMSLACGMKAIKGAIDRVDFDYRSKAFNLRTIDNSPPAGICGVGAISALHAFRLARLMTKAGSIDRSAYSNQIYQRDSVYGILLEGDNQHTFGVPMYISQMDIRMLQQSKAAIRTVIELLLNEANCEYNELHSLYITGAFGNGLNLKAATGINMIPPLPNLVSMHQKLGGALLGAELLLWSNHARLIVDEVYQEIKYVDMMSHPLYSKLHSEFSFFP